MCTLYSSQYEVDLAQMPLFEGPPKSKSSEWLTRETLFQVPVFLTSNRPILGNLHHLLGDIRNNFNIPAATVRASFSPVLHR